MTVNLLRFNVLGITIWKLMQGNESYFAEFFIILVVVYNMF